MTRLSRRVQSWYRPWLDGLGDWPAPELNTGDARRMEEILQVAAQEAVDRLDAMFGARSHGFGADSLARSMATVTADPDRAYALAWAATALDYHFYRAAPPRPQPGGLTNPRNRRIWSRLEPHIRKRLDAVLTAGAAGSIVWRTIFNRIPRNWVQESMIERALERQLAVSGAFESIHVETDLRTPAAGGDVWIADHTELSLAEIESELTARRPCLAELIRGTVRSPAAADVVVVYALRHEPDGAVRLAYHDPSAAGRRLDLTIRKANSGFLFRESEPRNDLPLVKAIRVWPLKAAVPPVFGLRRHLDSVLPWRLFWFVGRMIALAVARMRGRD